jgi:4-hydroxybenzoate polyprenyltransferase
MLVLSLLIAVWLAAAAGAFALCAAARVIDRELDRGEAPSSTQLGLPPDVTDNTAT